MKNASVTIRLGAGINTVTVDGHVFDRNALDRDQRYTLRKGIVDAFVTEQPKTRRRKGRNRRKENN